MDAPPRLRTVLTVTAGASPEPVRTFPWGTPVPPRGVGTNGEWAIAARDVLPLHFYFTFDGRLVHVAAAPSARVLLGESEVDGSWKPVPVGSEIRFGSAVIGVTCEDIPEPAPGPAPERVEALARTVASPYEPTGSEPPPPELGRQTVALPRQPVTHGFAATRMQGSMVAGEAASHPAGGAARLSSTLESAGGPGPSSMPPRPSSIPPFHRSPAPTSVPPPRPSVPPLRPSPAPPVRPSTRITPGATPMKEDTERPFYTSPLGPPKTSPVATNVAPPSSGFRARLFAFAARLVRKGD